MASDRWSRWKRRAPALALIALMLFAGGVSVVYYVLQRRVRGTVVYAEALRRLRANESAMRLLGPPVEVGWRVDGSVEQTGKARLTLPVDGTARAGTLHLRARKAGGAWAFSRLELTVEDNSTHLDLLEGRRQRDVADSIAVPPRYRE